MGRSRGVTSAGDDDASHRTKRRRVASSGETLETISTGPGSSEGKKALYHCNYCNKDLSGKIRIKCTKCPDFDLCVECFSVGAEVTPHKSNHPYRVMDNLSFPLICSDWNADEEILLLEGIEMYGLANWAEVAEHVGTKSNTQCIEHYTTAYLNSPCYPLPDMSRVNGKNRKELLAMAKIQGSSFLGDATIKAESPFSPSRVKVEDPAGDASLGRSPFATPGSNKKVKEASDGTRLEDISVDRSVGVKRPKYSGDEGPSMTVLSGYNPNRREFETEYDNDAEQVLAEMDFKENDSETDRDLKLRVLRIYLSRLDERERRKNFILDRNLLYPNPLEKELLNEDREIYSRYKVFMRFLSREDHDSLIKSVIEERKIRRRIQELQECCAAGCRTLAEAKMYTEQKRKKEHESIAQKSKDSSQIFLGSKTVHKITRPIKPDPDGVDPSKKGVTGFDSDGKDSPMAIRHGATNSWNEWDISGLPGADLLSETEQQLCCQNRLLPSHYLKMQEVLVQEIFKGNVAKKADAHSLFKVDPAKVDKVYEMVAKKLGHQEETATTT